MGGRRDLREAFPVLIVEAVVAVVGLPFAWHSIIENARRALGLAIVPPFDDAPLEGAVEPSIHV